METRACQVQIRSSHKEVNRAVECIFFILMSQTNKGMSINHVRFVKAMAIYFISEQDLEVSCEVIKRKRPDWEKA